MASEHKPVMVGRGPKFAEGVNFDRDGTLYCVDVEGGGIWRMPPGGSLQEWINTGGGTNGSRFGPNGDLFVADCKRNEILRITIATGAIAVYADSWNGQPLKAPNDLCFGPDGSLYFTTPGGSSLSNRIGSVYRIAPDGTVSRVTTGLAFPNGIMVTPDGQTLVVAETYTGILHRYSLDPARNHAELEPLATVSPAGDTGDDVGPDGMNYGADGNLYVAHYNGGVVHVIAPDGRLLADLPAGGPTTTNVGFWDESLYVTEGKSGSVYRIDIGVRENRPFMRPW